MAGGGGRGHTPDALEERKPRAMPLPNLPPRRAAAAASVSLLALLAVTPCEAYSVHRSRTLLQDAAPDAAASAPLPPRVAAALAGYLSNDELNAAVRALPSACPHLNVTVHSIGTSVKGADLLVVALASRGAAPSPLGRANVKYVAGLHGDEPSGRQLLLALAEYVCAHSAPGGSATPDARVAALLDRVALHLAPSLNPDGFAVRSRANAAGFDLNRDFPDPLDRRSNVSVGSGAADAHAARGMSPDPDADDADFLTPSGKEQPETAAIMRWILDTGFVASAAMHEGAIVANYPWDGTPDSATRYAACPDDATFKALAHDYAARSPTMFTSREFAATQGTTNGAAWYPLRGGMQDWNYLAGGCFELTLELSENKWPPPPALPGLFHDNLDSLLAFPLVATAGARGTVRAAGGASLPPGAAVRVRALKGAPAVRPHPVTGAFWRPLAPGNYTLVASAPGWAGAEGVVAVRGGPEGGGEVALTLTPEAEAATTLPQATAAAVAVATPARTVRAVEPRAAVTTHAERVSPYTHTPATYPRRVGPPILPIAPSVNLSGERAAFVAQGAVAVASAGCLALMARAASGRAAAVAAR